MVKGAKKCEKSEKAEKVKLKLGNGALIWRKTLELVFGSPTPFRVPHGCLFFSMNSHTGAAARLPPTFSFLFPPYRTHFLPLPATDTPYHTHTLTHTIYTHSNTADQSSTYQAESRMRFHYAAIVDSATPIG